MSVSSPPYSLTHAPYPNPAAAGGVEQPAERLLWRTGTYCAAAAGVPAYFFSRGQLAWQEKGEQGRCGGLRELKPHARARTRAHERRPAAVHGGPVRVPPCLRRARRRFALADSGTALLPR